MNKTFTKIKCTALAAAALSAFCAIPAFAQLNYRPANSTNIAGTYTDLGTTGTAITVANNDDANSAAQPIGFTFNYNGQAFTQFVLNTNGYIKLGATAPSAATMLDPMSSTNSANSNIISASSFVDLQGAANQTTTPTEFRVATTGTAPNRITTIQFENLSDKATAAANANAQFATIQFQIKLFETSNNIEIVYGAWTSNGATPTSGQPMIVGLKGTTATPNDWVFGYKPSSSSAWTATTFVRENPSAVGTAALHFVRNTFLPDAGRTYRFTPFVLPANDLAIQAVFVQGKVSKAGGAPTIVRAAVKNTGSTPVVNRNVTLDIAGGNTFSNVVTISKINPGKDTIVTFAPFTPTTVSNNNFVEVTTPNDGDNTNNADDANMVVTASTQGWGQYPTSGTNIPVVTLTRPAPIGTTAATNQGSYLARYVATTPVKVTKVRSYIPGPTFNTALSMQVGKTVYASVMDANGVEIGRSANKVLTANDLDKLVDFDILVPPTVTNQTYFAGVTVPLNPSATQFTYPEALQELGANIPNTFFAAPVAGTTPVAPTEILDKYLIVLEAEIVSILGTKEELNANLVSVYPNPSNGIFNVSAKDMKGNNVNFEVRDLQGKLVYSASAAKDNASLNLKNVASGVYMLKVSTDAQVAVKRLVVE